MSIIRSLTSALALTAALAASACGDDGSTPTAATGSGKPGTAVVATPSPDASFSVKVETASETAVVGGEILLLVTITNETDTKLRVNVPRLDRSCATVRVRLPDENPYVLERLYAEIDKRNGQLQWLVPDAQELEPGASATGEISLTAARPGKHHMTVSYKRSVRETAVTAQGVEVTVSPDGTRSNLGAQIETSVGSVTVRLRPDLAPNTVESFASLARAGFFDGLKFHRIMKQFMAQGGDPLGTGEGGPGYFLPLETNRDLLHDRGVLSMARTDHPDTAGSQFFLMFTRYPSLDPGVAGPGYTTFGETIEGDATLDALEAVETQIPEAIRKQLDAQGVPQEQIDMYVRSGRVPMSSPVEPTLIESVKIVAID